MALDGLAIIGESINDSVPSTHKLFDAGDIDGILDLARLQDEYRVITNTQSRLAGQRERERSRQPAPLRPGGTGGGSQLTSAPKNFEDNFDQTLRQMRANAE